MAKETSNTNSIKVWLDDTILHIDYQRTRKNIHDTISLNITDFNENEKHPASLHVLSYRLKNKIFLVQDIKDKGTLVVYTEGNRVCFYLHTDALSHPLSRLVAVKSKSLVWLNKHRLNLFYICVIVNPYNIKLKNKYFIIGDEYKKERSYPVYRSMPSILRIFKNKAIFRESVSIENLLKGEPAINAKIGVAIDIDGSSQATHFITKGSAKLEARGKKWFYAPIARTRRNGYSISIRRNGGAGLNLVRRQLSDVEKTLHFRFYESIIVSFILYQFAHFVRKLSKTQVNLYYEKSANQAEEGTIDLFRIARDNSLSKNYFIINEWSKDYPDIVEESGVVKNFTVKSYWLTYRANNLIASETAGHMNILRSDNKYIRLASKSQKFIFLQHGVTYMKAQDKNTSFKKGREDEPDYMVVNSKKERDYISETLGIEEERVLNTGMIIFDNIEYGHVNQNSPNKVTIMLTWKPYEEHFKDATKSTYYKTVVGLYSILEPLVGKDNIRIVAHPKFKEHMAKTDIGETMWHGAISEVLADTKLLITDYSSVCYNVFYQGGAVIYHQPDLEQYQQSNGKLIPNDDEYTGHRTFDSSTVESLLKNSIKDGEINLSKLRTKKHVDNYKTINEHHDGKNIDRIYAELVKLGIY